MHGKTNQFNFLFCSRSISDFFLFVSYPPVHITLLELFRLITRKSSKIGMVKLINLIVYLVVVRMIILDNSHWNVRLNLKSISVILGALQAFS